MGSGNLTFGGWGYNNEVLEMLRPGRDSTCFADLAAMLESMMRQSRPAEGWNASIHRISARSSRWRARHRPSPVTEVPGCFTPWMDRSPTR